MNKSTYTRKATAIGRRLRQAITHSDYSQAELCRQLDINKMTMQNWLNGRTAPDAVYLIELAKMLSLPLEYFYKNDDPVIVKLDEIKSLIIKQGKAKQ